MKKINVSPELDLPLEIASQCTFTGGIREGGKTNTASVFAEEFLKVGLPIMVFDPTDAWYGLLSSRDGKKAGYPVFIFGGPHGHLPLNETDGKAIAEFFVQERVPIILSMRHLRKGAQRRLFTDLCEELYHLKGIPENKFPMALFIDECRLFIPQKPEKGQERMVGAAEDVVLLGRNSGFGVFLINPRFSSVNKNVTTACDSIIAHRMPGPQDRKALLEWMENNTSAEESKKVLATLPFLKAGQAWVWSPRFDIFKKVQIRLRETFDSSATPKIGESIAPPKKIAEVDIEKLKGKLQESAEQSRANDPALLKKRVVELEGKLKERDSEPVKEVKIERVEVPVFSNGDVPELRELVKRLSEHGSQVISSSDDIGRLLEKTLLAMQGNGEKHSGMPPEQWRGPTVVVSDPSAHYSYGVPMPKWGQEMIENELSQKGMAESEASEVPVVSLSDPQKRMLDMLEWLRVHGVENPRRNLVAVLSSQGKKSSGFTNNQSYLRSKGLISYPSGKTLSITPVGSRYSVVGTRSEPGIDLISGICLSLPDPQATMLRILVGKFPQAMLRTSLAEQSGQSFKSSGYTNNLSALRAMGLLDYPDGSSAIASAWLLKG